MLLNYAKAADAVMAPLFKRNPDSVPVVLHLQCDSNQLPPSFQGETHTSKVVFNLNFYFLLG